MNVDPLASMRCWAVELELGGRTYEIPALPAADWWPVIVSGDPSRILDFIKSDPVNPLNIDDLLLSDQIETGELGTVILDAIEEVAGRSFHAAFVIASVAAGQWAAINGRMVLRGFRWDEQPIGAALDAIYAIVVEALDKDKLTRFLALLDSGTVRGADRKKVMTDFEEIAGPRPASGVKATGAPSDNARPRTRRRPRPRPPVGRSPVPRRPLAPLAGSDPPASSGSPQGAGAPASGIEPRPPL